MSDNTTNGVVLTSRADVPDGWYVQIVRQYGPASLAVGPYPSAQAAESAMNESLLIDAFCLTDCLDATVFAPADLDPVVELVIIDSDDPNDWGPVR